MSEIVRALVLSLALVAVGTPTLACAADAAKKEAPKKEATDEKKAEAKDEATYQCPMKCTPPQKGPGACSKCGMDLVKVEPAKK